MSPSRKYHQLDLGAHLENSGALGNASSTLHTHRPLGRGISSSHPYPAGSASHPSQHRLRAPSCCRAQCLHRGNLQPCMGSHMPRPWQTPERGYLQTLMGDMAKAEQGPGTAGNSQSRKAAGEQGIEVCCVDCAEGTLPAPEPTLPRVAPAQRDCGAACGAALLGRHRDGKANGSHHALGSSPHPGTPKLFPTAVYAGITPQS